MSMYVVTVCNASYPGFLRVQLSVVCAYAYGQFMVDLGLIESRNVEQV
jgi:hypothetical protein